MYLRGNAIYSPSSCLIKLHHATDFLYCFLSLFLFTHQTHSFLSFFYFFFLPLSFSALSSFLRTLCFIYLSLPLFFSFGSRLKNSPDEQVNYCRSYYSAQSTDIFYAFAQQEEGDSLVHLSDSLLFLKGQMKSHPKCPFDLLLSLASSFSLYLTSDTSQ